METQGWSDDSKSVSLEKIYRKYRSCLVRYAGRMMSNRLYAEDIVQDVFAKLVLYDYCFVSEMAALGFIYKAVNNRSIDMMRGIRKMEEISAAVESRQYSMNVDDRLEYKELYLAVERQIASLPPKCRKIFVLKYKRQQSNPEIGRLLGLSVRTVENQVYIARNILRKCIGE